MPLFVYKGQNEDGARRNGRVEAPDEQAALEQLRTNGIFASKIAPVKEPIKIEDLLSRRRRVPQDQLVLFTRQMATLIDAGVAILQALNILEKQIENARFKDVVRDVIDQVESGQQLAEALRKHPDVFSSLFISMVDAGENSGTLDESLSQLALQLEQASRLQKQIKAAMRYPLIILGVAVMVLVLLLVFVVPRFRSLFSSLGGDLPIPTKVVISLSQVLVPPDGKLLPVVPAIVILILAAAFAMILFAFRRFRLPPMPAFGLGASVGLFLGGLLYLFQFEPAFLTTSPLVAIPGGVSLITFFYDHDFPSAFVGVPQIVAIFGRVALLYVVFMILRSFWRRFIGTPEGRRAWDAFRLKAPLKIGSLVQKISMARFTRTLATLIKSGVPILTAFDIVRETAGNVLIEEAADEARQRVAVGSTIYSALDDSPAFPSLVTRMVQVGEETGALDEMLLKCAEYYEEEVDIAMKNIASLIEPVMVILIGLIVGSIVIALYLPIFGIFQLLEA
ncbi:type II secretion system F family protein [Miltoncostaea oceani]|uniref:type II secretion system F family protein n=1 Tax=Miltoncostaea oceani TaxID=2843216 RepID=UPI001C3CB1C1|nr:type II secretion system F family protein [Miltoncostaea oceani]